MLAIPNLEHYQIDTGMYGQLDMSSVDPLHTEKQSIIEENSDGGVNGKLKTWKQESSLSSCGLLEFAAENDLNGFRRCVEDGDCQVDVAGPWYTRKTGSRQMVLEQRTPVMIAALYGSVDVLKYIVKLYGLVGADIDQACGHDGFTALHCAAAGGSMFAMEAVKILLDLGADVNVLDSYGRRPADVINVPHRLGHLKKGLEEMLNKTKSAEAYGRMGPEFPDYLNGCFSSSEERGLSVEDGEGAEIISSKALSSTSLGSGVSSLSSPSPSSSPKSPHTMAAKLLGDGSEKNREYPVDPSLPDIKNSIYTTDEFRMYSFKIRPCSRAYSHDWTECPFVHPGENARRRDPRRYHYSCVPCPEFRKGSCRRGDACEYAHGVFECWLHPAQYRTRLCKDGTSCNRRVCFFAHTAEELRPLYVSTGSGMPSPRTSTFMDMSLMSPPLAPGSPLILPSFSPSHSVQSTVHGTPPMSPSPSSPAPSPYSGTWAHPSIPSLHLPGASLQSSRLRAALMGRNGSVGDMVSSSDFDGQMLSDFQSLSAQSLSTQARLNAAVAASSGSSITSSHAGKYRNLGISVTPTNLEELLASEGLVSPNSAMRDPSVLSQFETHVNAQPHFPYTPVSVRMQQQHAQQSAFEAQLNSPTKGSSFSLGSLSRMSFLGGLDAERYVTHEAPISPSLAAARAAFAQRDKRSHSSRDLGANFMSSEWGSPMGKPEWSVQRDDLSKLRKSSSFGVRGNDEPDLSWVQRLVKEVPLDTGTRTMFRGDGSDDIQRESAEISLLGTWIDKLKLDQINS